MEGHTPFFSKERGRSHTVSDFIIQHPYRPFFSLSDAEFALAAKNIPPLFNPDGINYLKNSASTGINVGEEGYFND